MGYLGSPHDLEYRWEISHGRCLHTAKLVEEIAHKPGRAIEDTMVPRVVMSEICDWTVSALTRRGLERRIARYERKHGFVGERVEMTWANGKPRDPRDPGQEERRG